MDTYGTPRFSLPRCVTCSRKTSGDQRIPAATNAAPAGTLVPDPSQSTDSKGCNRLRPALWINYRLASLTLISGIINTARPLLEQIQPPQSGFRSFEPLGVHALQVWHGNIKH